MWHSLKYTDDIPEGFEGIARLWFIRIRPSRRWLPIRSIKAALEFTDEQEEAFFNEGSLFWGLC